MKNFNIPNICNNSKCIDLSLNLQYSFLHQNKHHYLSNNKYAVFAHVAHQHKIKEARVYRPKRNDNPLDSFSVLEHLKKDIPENTFHHFTPII